MTSRTVHLRISGLVQGVSYRVSAQEQALSLGLTGWVRNLPNGDVEALAAGAADSVASFVTWCHRGPEEARVSNVVVSDAQLEAGTKGFSVRR